MATLLAGCAGTSADHLLAEGQSSEAIAAYAPAIVDHPMDSRLKRNLGAAHYAQGDLSAAERSLEEAATIDPSDPQTLFFLGRVREESGNPAGAIAAYADYLDNDGEERAWVRARMREIAAEAASSRDVDLTHGTAPMMSEAVSRPDTARVPSSATPGRSATYDVAVLDFVDIIGDEAYASLGAGLSQLVTTDLQSATGLRVLPREWSNAFESISSSEDPADRFRAFEDSYKFGPVPNVVLQGRFRRLGPAALELTMTRMDTSTGERDSIKVSGALTDATDLEKSIVAAIVDWFGPETGELDDGVLKRSTPRTFETFLDYCGVVERVDRLAASSRDAGTDRDSLVHLPAVEIATMVRRVFEADRRFAKAVALGEWTPVSDSAADVEGRELRRLLTPVESDHDLSLDLSASVGNGPAPDPGVGSQVSPGDGEASDLTITDGSKVDPSVPTIPDFPMPPGGRRP